MSKLKFVSQGFKHCLNNELFQLFVLTADYFKLQILLSICEFQTLFYRSFKNMSLPNIMQNFQCDLNNVFLSEGFEGFEMHPSTFDFLKCDLKNVFSSGGVESFKLFPQSFDCCLHCHNTMSPLKPFANFKYRLFFSDLCLFLVLCFLWLIMLQRWILLVVVISQLFVTHSQLLEGLKCESQT